MLPSSTAAPPRLDRSDTAKSRISFALERLCERRPCQTAGMLLEWASLDRRSHVA
jgi:hypothetical protein